MLDYDKGLLASLLKEGAPSVRKSRELLPSSSYLSGESKKVYEFIVEYTSKYGASPSLELVQQHTGVHLLDPLASDEELSAPSPWWIEKINDRHLHEELQRVGKTLVTNLEHNRTDEALYSVENAIRMIRRERDSLSSGVQGIGPLAKEVWEYFEMLKSGKRGVLFPWEGMNDATLGMWPQDLGLFVARPGTGKTWSATLIALNAWQNGNRVVFATTEMSRMRIAMRMLAIKLKFSYNDFRRGSLSILQEKKFQEEIELLMEDENFYVAGGDFDFRVESYISLMDEYEPNLCVLDGAYLLKVDGVSRTDKAANAFNEVKRTGNVTGVPQLCTMQFNRNTKANMAGTADLANIGLTDVAGWNTDFAYALMQTDDQKKDGIMEFHPMKVREGVGQIVRTRWDLDNMVFDEIPIEDDSFDFGASQVEEAPFNPLDFGSKDKKSSEDDDLPF